MARRFVPNRRRISGLARKKYGWVTTGVFNSPVPVSTAATAITVLQSDDWRQNPILNDKATLVAVYVDLVPNIGLDNTNNSARGYLASLRHLLLNNDNDEPTTIDMTAQPSIRDEDILHLGVTAVGLGAEFLPSTVYAATSLWRPKLSFRAKTKRKLYADTEIRLYLGRENMLPLIGSDTMTVTGYIRALIQQG